SIRRQTQDGGTRERLDKIDIQRRLATRIIEEIMTFTQASAIDRKETDIVALLRTAADQASAYRKEGVTLSLDLGETPILTAVDSLKMSQAFVNLIKNAYQATDHGVVSVALSTEDATIRIVVRDTGKGMSPEERELVFKPFFTTKPQGDGVGLGLSFVEAVVEAHGGHIDVASEAGKGSTFTLRLPILAGSPQAREDSESA
ncbi:MAG TPA: HAMP domain-containing sensor histidine kinase, partial [Thermoplasmata archaeon]|nr:HAMP domain-containing sensor histidine kinase [Thermoplasmata archaeon]